MKPTTLLVAMRMADCRYQHPKQITMPCSICSETVAVWPSGQRVLQEAATKVICQICVTEAEKLRATAVPDALKELIEVVKDPASYRLR